MRASTQRYGQQWAANCSGPGLSPLSYLPPHEQSRSADLGSHRTMMLLYDYIRSHVYACDRTRRRLSETATPACIYRGAGRDCDRPYGYSASLSSGTESLRGRTDDVCYSRTREERGSSAMLHRWRSSIDRCVPVALQVQADPVLRR
ncbi:hypothetical protein PUNSTDRAFT_118482 [Punctularia strigosozonata HHB-11173 SS5]|uniref:uncharacterized protein n=1 Tax=Punctularia strigosozonata (strain HHB-11173) TaxID=741275 RepID=UPI00044164C6|nr:uncharacterized protein PUNSTDRAFT_118482 [Punctularia strigosozonata HHB-11173 SS5]EIN12778.1 hypothetical protein PUNSTDRAFT_118482 [Punctularia strigosozonata HHB-11173 SS5]